MNLYEINAKITELIDPETGEILDYDAFAALAMEQQEKQENMALWYKDLCAEAEAIRNEEKALAERRKACERRAERLKEFLSQMLCGSAFKTARVAVSFRSSTAVEIADEAAFIQAMEENGLTKYLKYSAPEVNKTAIKDAIKQGEVIEGAELVKRQNMTIK